MPGNRKNEINEEDIGEKKGYCGNYLKPIYEEDETMNQKKWDDGFKNLKSHVLEILEKLGEKSSIEHFKIGKTFARKLKKKEFVVGDFNTWKLAGGVNGRWKDCYGPDGYDALIVLTAFTRNMFPKTDSQKKRYNQQDIALALEEQLIHYFMFIKGDIRLENKSFNEGKRGDSSIAAVLYIAVKFKKETDMLQQPSCSVLQSTNRNSYRVNKEDIGKMNGYCGDYLNSILEEDQTINRKRMKDGFRKLKLNLEKIMEDLGKKYKINQFKIGQTYARKLKRKPFDANDFNTWKLAGGVNGQWRKSYRPDGYDVLIVLTAFTSNMLPKPDREKKIFDQHDLALTFGNHLIDHFLLMEKDKRLGNTSINEVKNGDSSIAAVLYIAIKFEKETATLEQRMLRSTMKNNDIESDKTKTTHKESVDLNSAVRKGDVAGAVDRGYMEIPTQIPTEKQGKLWQCNECNFQGPIDGVRTHIFESHLKHKDYPIQCNLCYFSHYDIDEFNKHQEREEHQSEVRKLRNLNRPYDPLPYVIYNESSPEYQMMTMLN